MERLRQSALCKALFYLDNHSLIIQILAHNTFINYESLGLDFILLKAECLHNRGLVSYLMGDDKSAMNDFQESLALTQEESHRSMLSSMLSDMRGSTQGQNQIESCQLFALPPLLCFTPPMLKVQNRVQRMFMKRSRTVVGVDQAVNADQEDINSIYDLYA